MNYVIETDRTAEFLSLSEFQSRSGNWPPAHGGNIQPLIPDIRSFSNQALTFGGASQYSLPEDIRIMSAFVAPPGQLSGSLTDLRIPVLDSFAYDPDRGFLVLNGSSTAPLQSASILPLAEVVGSFSFPFDNSTASVPDAAVIEATSWMSKAQQAAQNAELRKAYFSAYRGLDLLLKSARWKEVSTQLEAICTDQFPAEFGIGTMRFVSLAAERIPNWTLILRRLATVAQRQGLDVRRTMRGLLDSDGIK